MGQQAAGTADGNISDHDLVDLYGVLLEGWARTDAKVRIERMGELELPGPWFDVLLRLLRTPGRRLPMTRLAHDVSLTSGGFTKLADRMARAGLIDRQPCATDRRITYAVLTPHGVRTAEDGRRRHAALLRRHVLGPLGAGRVRQLADLMDVLREANSVPGVE